MKSASTQKSAFRHDIQGLRGIAVAAVVASHLGVPFLGGGFLGVDIFYVISGYLIVGLMFREATRSGKVSLAGFYARRARRILPAALFVVGIVALCSRLLMNPLRSASVIADAPWAALFGENLRLAHQGADYFAQGAAVSPLQHFWSLAVEEQFYLVLPVVFVMAFVASGRRRGRDLAPVMLGLVLTVTLASLAWSIHATATAPTAAYFSSLTRAWQLGVGALAGIAVQAWPQLVSPRVAAPIGLAGAAGIIVSFATISGIGYPGAVALLPTISAACVLAAGAFVRDGVLQRLLSARWLGHVGLVSFSLYLWHWPVIVFGDIIRPGLMPALRIPLLFAVSLALAAASYVIVEKPFMKLALRRSAQIPGSSRRRAAYATLVCTVTMAVLVFVTPAPSATHGRGYARKLARCSATQNPASLRAWRCQIRTSAHLTYVPPNLDPPLRAVIGDRENSGCLNVSEANVDQCRWGSPTATRTVAVLGDSHAEMWLTALKAAFPADRFVIQSLTMGRCPNSEITRVEPGFPTLGADCEAHRAWVLGWLTVHHPDIVVMSDSEGFARWKGDDGTTKTHGTLKRWATGLAAMLQRVRPLTNRLVLIGQTPRSRKLAECLPADLKLTRCMGANTMAEQRSIESAEVHAVGGMFVNPAPWLCYRNTCPLIIGHTAAYWDNSHLTHSITQQLAPRLVAALRPVTRMHTSRAARGSGRSR